MNQLDQITQQNASAAEEIAATAETLASQSDDMKELISFFDIGGSNKSVLKIEQRNNSVVKAKQETISTGITIPEESDYTDTNFSDF